MALRWNTNTHSRRCIYCICICYIIPDICPNIFIIYIATFSVYETGKTTWTVKRYLWKTCVLDKAKYISYLLVQWKPNRRSFENQQSNIDYLGSVRPGRCYPSISTLSNLAPESSGGLETISDSAAWGDLIRDDRSPNPRTHMQTIFKHLTRKLSRVESRYSEYFRLFCPWFAPLVRKKWQKLNDGRKKLKTKSRIVKDR